MFYENKNMLVYKEKRNLLKNYPIWDNFFYNFYLIILTLRTIKVDLEIIIFLCKFSSFQKYNLYNNVEKIYFLHIANTKAISNFRILKTKAFLGVDKGCLLC